MHETCSTYTGYQGRVGLGLVVYRTLSRVLTSVGRSRYRQASVDSVPRVDRWIGLAARLLALVQKNADGASGGLSAKEWRLSRFTK